jgi:microsomal dipeptidase-like Zn-dependent dipeptidase
MATRPPIVSHTGVLGAFEHWRNIGDDALRAVAQKGGCVGVIFCPKFLGADGLGAVVKHLKHIVDVCGEDTPALGSDWDGFIIPTADLCDAARLPLLTDALLEAGSRSRRSGKSCAKCGSRAPGHGAAAPRGRGIGGRMSDTSFHYERFSGDAADMEALAQS